jgi:hypothetical protein
MLLQVRFDVNSEEVGRMCYGNVYSSHVFMSQIKIYRVFVQYQSEIQKHAHMLDWKINIGISKVNFPTSSNKII